MRLWIQVASADIGRGWEDGGCYCLIEGEVQLLLGEGESAFQMCEFQFPESLAGLGCLTVPHVTSTEGHEGRAVAEVLTFH